MSIARQNSVSQLAELYNVVIGVSLSIGIYNSVDSSAFPIPIKLNQIINVATFVIILVPFYHGAVRHLFATYVEGGGSARIKNGALLADFFLLFLEGCVFVLLASILGETERFVCVLILLLLLDSIWGFLAWLAFTGAQAQYAECRWALLNVFTAALIGVLLVFHEDIFLSKPLLSQAAFFAILAVRTIFDYYFNWSFYFPPHSQGK
jgi:hypothetical protein